jgi:hypothetical protein
MKPAAGLYLHADLHANDPSGRDLGFVAGVHPLPIEEGKSDYSFEPEVPDRPDLASVRGIIYLSRGDSFGTNVCVARLKPVPIEGREIVKGHKRTEPTNVFVRTDEPTAYMRDLVPLRIAVAVILAIGGAAAYVRRRRPEAILFFLCCLAASICEALLLGLGTTGIYRGLARETGAYDFRRGPQAAASLAVLACGVAFAVRALWASFKDGRPAGGLAWLGIISYWIIAGLRFISYHDMDYLLAGPVAGIQVGQAARTLSAVLCSASALAESLSIKGCKSEATEAERPAKNTDASA